MLIYIIILRHVALPEKVFSGSLGKGKRKGSTALLLRKLTQKYIPSEITGFSFHVSLKQQLTE